MVSQLIDSTGAKSLLDYGCGRMCNLAKHIEPGHDVDYIAYDPGVPEFSQEAEPADLVCCIDVLEHIEPDCLDNVLSDLRRCVKGHGFFTIHTGPAVKLLSDGRNAHLIQQPPSWWLPKLMQRWTLLQFQANKHGFWVVMHGN
jgi:2-polyprenyl-3-methyl-5-hydroxy-6-metoxy-1,4-benzoquinol methylase